MTLKIYNPTTSSRRGLVLVDRAHLWRGKPFKALTEGKLSTGGRCATGRITVRHKGGGHKKRYRMIDFRRREQGDAVVQRLEYDPNRSGFIALVRKEDSQENAYILAPEGVRPGDVLSSGNSVAIKTGNTLPLKNIPMGVFVHNVGMKVGKGGQIARSAGASAQIMGRDGVYVLVRLPSSEVRKIHGDCCATIGVMSNGDHKNRVIAKAGRNRWKGIRPTVRGVAMNPIDHPHGGGEGKTSGGRHPVTPWGVSTKGKKTRDRKRPSSSMIVTRRKK